MPLTNAISLNRLMNQMQYTKRRVPQILLITEDVELGSRIGQMLEHSGYDVTHCRNADSLQQRADRPDQNGDAEHFDLVICEARLLDELAIGALQRLCLQRQPPLLLLRQANDKAIATLAARLRAIAVCAKFDVSSQLALVRQIAPITRPNGRPRQDPS
jgi:DNA-binding response OmpR family regulator